MFTKEKTSFHTEYYSLSPKSKISIPKRRPLTPHKGKLFIDFLRKFLPKTTNYITPFISKFPSIIHISPSLNNSLPNNNPTN